MLVFEPFVIHFVEGFLATFFSDAPDLFTPCEVGVSWMNEVK